MNWEFRHSPDCHFATICEDGKVLAELHNVGDSQDVLQRGHMMAAAPELYAACSMALHAFQDGWAINWDDLRRALAKAMGETA